MTPPLTLRPYYARTPSQCYVIAEAGSNHCGMPANALRLVQIAKDSGADAVKFQLFPRTWDEDNHTPPSWLPTLHQTCTTLGIDLIVSVFSQEAVEQASPYVSALKIASPEIVDLELIHYASRSDLPIILSCGMASVSEINRAISICVNRPLVHLLDCVSAYPADPSTLNLRRIRVMKDWFACPVGLSDHTTSAWVPAFAAALGADIVEKHFTLPIDHLPSPDHSFSLKPDDLQLAITRIRSVERWMGPTPSADNFIRQVPAEVHSARGRTVPWWPKAENGDRDADKVKP